MVHFRRARHALTLGHAALFPRRPARHCRLRFGNDCATNPFELGQRDGVLGSNQGGRYASACGSSFDAARYTDGFRDGFSRRPPPQGD